MLFSTPQFLIFLPLSVAVICVLSVFGRKASLAAIVAVSLIFYSWFRADYTVLLVGSAAANYIVAGQLKEANRQRVFLIGVAVNLCLLAVFKYADFIIATVNSVLNSHFAALGILLPIAISFITFEQISFLSDIKSQTVARGSLLEYLAFVTLFPKLIAGPIIRYREIRPQLLNFSAPKPEQIFTGFCIFCFGLFKKVAIADVLVKAVDEPVRRLAAGNMLSQADATSAMIAYSLQIYFDFSAYSEMALGIAWMLGILLPVNFYSPYLAVSLIEFWRRWHITLSSFLRDYIYFPLGGNRNGRLATARNLLIVMLIGGLWHGAAWTFVGWGLIHGLALVAAHGLKEATAIHSLLGRRATVAISWSVSMLVVLFAWVFFRSPDFETAFRWLASIFADQQVDVGLVAISQRWFIVAVLFWVWLLPNVPQLFNVAWTRDRIDWENVPGIPPVSLRCSALAALALVVSIVIMFREPPNAFIYFQF